MPSTKSFARPAVTTAAAALSTTIFFLGSGFLSGQDVPNDSGVCLGIGPAQIIKIGDPNTVLRWVQLFIANFIVFKMHDFGWSHRADFVQSVAVNNHGPFESQHFERFNHPGHQGFFRDAEYLCIRFGGIGQRP